MGFTLLELLISKIHGLFVISPHFYEFLTNTHISALPFITIYRNKMLI
jgi:hypothetical protein